MLANGRMLKGPEEWGEWGLEAPTLAQCGSALFTEQTWEETSEF